MPNTNHSPYFRNVSEEDYSFLKARESHIWEEVKKRLYAEGLKVGEKELEKNKPELNYSSRNQILAVSIGEKRDKRRILRGIDLALMNDLEKRIFFATRSVLGESLEGIRLDEEDWE